MFTTAGAGAGAGVNFLGAGLDSELKILDSDHLWLRAPTSACIPTILNSAPQNWPSQPTPLNSPVGGPLSCSPPGLMGPVSGKPHKKD